MIFRIFLIIIKIVPVFVMLYYVTEFYFSDHTEIANYFKKINFIGVSLKFILFSIYSIFCSGMILLVSYLLMIFKNKNMKFFYIVLVGIIYFPFRMILVNSLGFLYFPIAIAELYGLKKLNNWVMNEHHNKAI